MIVELSYAECLKEAAKMIGIKDPVIKTYDPDPNYQGEIDLYLQGNYSGKMIYFHLHQSYGSCSYCDWLQGAGEWPVISYYKKQLEAALGII